MESLKFVTLALSLPSLPSGMLGKQLNSPLLAVDSASKFCHCKIESSIVGVEKWDFITNYEEHKRSFEGFSCAVTTFENAIGNETYLAAAPSNIRSSVRFLPSLQDATWASNLYTKRWMLHSTTQIESIITTDEDQSMWEACRQALSSFNFSEEEKDKILGKAFGLVHSPYWGEERKMEIPKYERVNAVLDYLRSLNLSDDDLSKLLKKFPEVLGCKLEEELKANVKILDEQWDIQGKTLRNLLLRNPKVLGYNVDCKGDCMAQCTRCWVRF